MIMKYKMFQIFQNCCPKKNCGGMSIRMYYIFFYFLNQYLSAPSLSSPSSHKKNIFDVKCQIYFKIVVSWKERTISIFICPPLSSPSIPPMTMPPPPSPWGPNQETGQYSKRRKMMESSGFLLFLPTTLTQLPTTLASGGSSLIASTHVI